MQMTSTQLLQSSAAVNWRIDWPAKLLVATCALNLNGVFNMMLDVDQAASIVILGSSLVLIALVGRNAWSAPTILLLSAVATYLIFGAFFYDSAVSIDPAWKYLQSYFNSVIIIWALAGYTAGLEPGPRLQRFIAFVRNVFLVAAASVWSSPILYQYYVNLPFSFEHRMGGFFANPNEAAMASVLAIALTLGMPFRSRLLQAMMIAMAAIAVFLTFSKTGMTCMVVVAVWYLARNARGIKLVLLAIGALAAIVFIQDPSGILTSIADNPLIELDEGQKRRLLAVGDILGGQIDERTSTGRTYLWSMMFEHAWDNFPLGSGLGSAHYIIGGVRDLGVWQGAHNTFLMVWGESGVLPALLLVVATACAFVAAVRRSSGSLELMCLFVLVIDMIVTHGALATRYHNVMLAVVLGLIGTKVQANSLKHSERTTIPSS